MFEFMKSPLNKIVKQKSADAVLLTPSNNTNPFNTNPEPESRFSLNSAKTASPESLVVTQNDRDNLLNEGKGGSRAASSSYSTSSAMRSKYRNDFRESGGLDSQSVQELEGYTIYKAEETTKSVNGCLKIAEDIREEASRILVAVNEQGEQITKIHNKVADIDHDLSRGEKLLGSLGGMFSKTWKPKKSHHITGPTNSKGYLYKEKESKLEERNRLGLVPAPRGQTKPLRSSSEPTTSFLRVEAEKEKQDDALNDLSNILGELKNMAIGMGSEIDSQIVALEPFHKDVDELNHRVKGANLRGQHLLRK